MVWWPVHVQCSLTFTVGQRTFYWSIVHFVLINYTTSNTIYFKLTHDSYAYVHDKGNEKHKTPILAISFSSKIKKKLYENRSFHYYLLCWMYDYIE